MRGLRASLVVTLLSMSTVAAHADDFYSGSSTYLDLGAYQTLFKYADVGHQADVGRWPNAGKSAI